MFIRGERGQKQIGNFHIALKIKPVSKRVKLYENVFPHRYTFMQIKLMSWERFHTRTCLETEAQGNLEIAYYMTRFFMYFDHAFGGQYSDFMDLIVLAVFRIKDPAVA